MAIKLKNKYLYTTLLLVCIYLLSISTFSFFDLLNNKDYLGKYAYFNSYSYKSDLNDYLRNISSLFYQYRDYSSKTDLEKLTAEEIKNITDKHEKNLEIEQSSIEKEYYSDISKAEAEGNKTKVNELKTERDKKIEKLKSTANKAIEDEEKQLVSMKDADYENIKNSIDENHFIRYYIKDKKSGQVYTNIETKSKLDDYIKESALYVDSYPKVSNNDYVLQNIDLWFNSYKLEGKFIFLKSADESNQMVKNYIYYNSIKDRIIKEAILGVGSLIAAVFMLICLRGFIKEGLKYAENFRNKYESIPIDLRVFLFFLYYFIMKIYFRETMFFYKPIGIGHIIKLTFAAIYVLYILINMLFVIGLTRSKERFKEQCKNSIIYQLVYLIAEGLKVKGLMFRLLSIFTLTALFGMFIALGVFAYFKHSKFFCFISTIYILIYLLVIPIYILKRIVLFNRIVKGTDEIAAGNLNYFIEESGNNKVSRLAHNINSMKDSFKQSVESQVKSERLKTELISNVSHDLKTPLTSIINFVSLLKKGGLSEEESRDYIEVLDQKAQRLKVLIEDLFEASKVSSGAVELNIETVDIVALLRQALGESDERISSSSLIFKTNIPTEEVYLKLDGKKTWRVFENLINNALKYSQRESRVYIDLIENADNVVIIMKNMSSYEMDFKVEEIFERFKRGDKARSTDGSGLGLSIAKSIVELQGGKMNIDIDGDLFKVTIEFKK